MNLAHRPEFEIVGQSETASRTIFEQISERLRIPYLVLAGAASIFFTAPFLEYGFPGTQEKLITTYFNPDLGVIRSSYDLAGRVLLFFFFFVVIYSIRSIRTKLSDTRTAAASLSMESDQILRSSLRSSARLLPPAVMSLVLLIVYVLLYLGAGMRVELSILPVFILDLFLILGRAFIIFAYVWAYISSVVGLYRGCRAPLRLTPYYVDEAMGLKPLGSLSLHFSFTYSLAITLGIAWILFQSTDLVLVGLAFVLLPLGLVFFFLPIRRLHSIMAEEKRMAKGMVKKRFPRLFADSDRHEESSSESVLSEIKEDLEFMIRQGQISSIRTWPFETQVLEQFLGILITVAAIVLARMAQIALGL